jgi:hypothetical protein
MTKKPARQALEAWDELKPSVPFDPEPSFSDMLTDNHSSEGEFRRKQHLKDQYDLVRQWQDVRNAMVQFIINLGNQK